MKAFGTVLGVILACAILTSLLAAGYFLVVYILRGFAGLGSEAGTIAALASVVAILCSAVLADGLKARGNALLPDSWSGQKSLLYEQLLALHSVAHQEPAAAGRSAERARLERLLALHGGKKVIAAYVKTRDFATDGQAADSATELLKTLAMEMRSDLGNLNAFGRDADNIVVLLRNAA